MVFIWLLIAGGLLGSAMPLCLPEETSQLSILVTCSDLMRSGSEAKVCATILRPNETLLLSIYLVQDEGNTLLGKKSLDRNFHGCSTFRVPVVTKDTIKKIKVEVRGNSTYWTSETLVKFSPKLTPVTLIQTDKPIYTPGQTVYVRAVTMDTKFIPLNQQYHLVTLEDSRGNVIAQWQNMTSHKKILQLSHVLNSEAIQGLYTLVVAGELTRERHSFQVKKYVLPRFEVILSSLDEISIGAPDLRIGACARYTFQQPVLGEASVSLCRHQDASRLENPKTPPRKICSSQLIKVEKTGCAAFVFALANFTQDSGQKLTDLLNLEVTVTEEGTGITQSSTKIIRLSYAVGKVAFFDMPDEIEMEGVLVGKVLATHYNGSGIPFATVYLFKGPRGKEELVQTLTTDSNGVAQFTKNITKNCDYCRLTVSLTREVSYIRYRTPYFEFDSKEVTIVKPGSSPSAALSSVSIKAINEPLSCGTKIPITIKYAFRGEDLVKASVDIVYLVLHRSNIVLHGFKNLSIGHSVAEGEVTFTLSVIPEMVPSVRVLVYCILPSKTVLAGSRTFQTEKCFKNKVSLGFTPPRAVPGESSSLRVSALPGSLCGLGVVDQSVAILEPGKGLSPEKVFDLLRPFDSYVSGVDDPVKCQQLRQRRALRRPQPQPEESVLAVFRRMGLKAVSNLVLQTPDCFLYNGHRYVKEFVAYTANTVTARAKIDAANADVSVRSFFPETWIWQLLEVGESGVAQVPVTVPDTITTWQSEAFCLSPQGFGLAPSAQLTVFQPFFVEVSLPYSIIRGETLELKATVFNFMQKCILVTVIPAPSPDFTLSPPAGQYSCLCANERKTFIWTMVPFVLGVINVNITAQARPSTIMCGNDLVTVPKRGAIDILTRSLLVTAEGTPKTESITWLLCPKGEEVLAEVTLDLPESVVRGSARATVTVLGDLLGRALRNIGDLLKVPYGCGEQNMGVFGPNLYILQYLHNTGRLTGDIKEKATNFLKNGYQRQLNYRHTDGSFSTFGRGEGNTWLTAFVLKCFGQAKDFIYIDPKVTAGARSWLDGTLKNGVFQMRGRLFNNRMKGGINDDVTTTAYVSVAVLELKMTVATSTMNFLKSSVSDLPNTYATALMAYTFSLAGEKALRAQLLAQLDSLATSEGNLLYWSQSKSERADPLAVETTSYVLLAVLTSPSLTAFDLGKASRIVNWLVRQQNPQGGFSSTQDTVVALQALALYATKVFSPSGSSTVVVKSSAGDKHTFSVNQQNALLYQEKVLRDVPGKYSIEVTGSACASVGVALYYNIPFVIEETTLSIKAEAKTIIEGDCFKAIGQTLRLNITVQYSGLQDVTNMAVLEIKLLSGFSPLANSIAALQHSPLVDRVDQMEDHIFIYLSEIPKSILLHYQLIIRQEVRVNNLKPAMVRVYDYYQPRDQARTEYTSPCAGRTTAEVWGFEAGVYPQPKKGWLKLVKEDSRYFTRFNKVDS